MASYNIYAGLSFPTFQYVMHNTTEEKALEEARDLAIEMFENSSDFGELWDEYYNIAIEQIEKLPEYTDVMYNWMVTKKANQLYEEKIDEFISYNVMLYEE